MEIFKKNNAGKCFCLSMQRSGTTSVGKFFRDIGLPCAGWSVAQQNNWSTFYHDGNLEAIFTSRDFVKYDAFEDGPWFHPGFYKILFHRIPGSRFVLLERDPDDWFASMIRHSGGRILGRAGIHSKIYRREKEYLDLLDKAPLGEVIPHDADMGMTLLGSGLAEHYKDLYILHNREVRLFFAKHAPDALFVGQLEDQDKWQKLAHFFGVKIPSDYDCHENASP